MKFKVNSVGLHLSSKPLFRKNPEKFECLYFPAPGPGPGSQFVFTGLGPRFVFTGPGPKFVFTGSGLQ